MMSDCKWFQVFANFGLKEWEKQDIWPWSEFILIQKSHQSTNLQKSGNWGLDEIDCHCSHKGQCTSKKYFSSYLKKLWKEIFEEKKFEEKQCFEKKFWKIKFGKQFWKKILETKTFEKKMKKNFWKNFLEKRNFEKKILKKNLEKNFEKKSGNWGLNEIDCHCSHKGQCTSKNTFLLI